MTKLVIQLGMYKKAALNALPTFLQQFGILTNAIIVDKFPNLSNYRVAFQLILKNDENTKAIGVSVFKLDSQFILVPAFFNKGKIKTGDMMYIQSIDTFRPLSDAWLADVRNMKLALSGLQVAADSAAMLTLAPSSIRVKESTDPIIKSASMLQAVTDNTVPLYNIFNAAARLGKKASMALVRLLQLNTAFANGTIQFYGKEAVDEFVKLASDILADEPEPDFATVITPLDKQASTLSQELREALYRDGYFIKTASDEWQDSRDVLKATVVDTINNQFATPSNNCSCRLLDILGNLHDALVFVPQTVLDGACDRPILTCGNMLPSYIAMSNMLRDGAIRYGVAPGESVYCKLPSLVIAQTSSIDSLKGSADAGVELGGSVRCIPYQSMLITPAGLALLILTSLEYVGTGKTWASYSNKTVHVADTDIIRPVVTDRSITVPKNTRIVFPSGYTEHGQQSLDKDGRRLAKLSKLKCCTVKSILFALDNYKRKHYDKVKVYTLGTQYVVSDTTGLTKPMQAKLAALHIVRQYNVIPKVAKLMLLDTLKGAHSNKPKRNVFYITKKALEDVNWQRSNAAMTQTSNGGPNVTNISMDQFKQDPQQLLSAIQAATDTGIRLVFDVTAMKLLVQAGDVSEYIGEYTTDFMRCLDKLCRLLFMVYWHSDAMLLKYGMLKLRSLEQSIKNAIDSLSLLAVFLKLRGFGSVDSDTNMSNAGLVGGEML